MTLAPGLNRARLGEQAFAWVRAGWAAALAGLLAALVLGVAAYSTGLAHWVAEPGLYVAGLWLGAVCGAALAASRYHGRYALAYSLTLALISAAAAAGRLWPPLSELFAPTLWQDIHARTLSLGDRAAGWASTLLSGGTLRDTGLFILVTHWLVWQAAAWLMWSLLRRRAALAGLIPLAALVGLNNQLANRPANEYGLFLGFGLCLLAHRALAAALADWERRAVDYAEAIALDWELVNVLLVVLLSLGVFLAGRWGPPAAWHELADLFRSAQAQTAETAERLFGGVKPPAAPVSAGTARLPDLDHIGQPLPQGDEPIMWVTVSDPAPPPPEAAGPPAPHHYWRSRIFSTYTGLGWEPAASGEPEAEEPAAPLGRYRLRQRFQLEVPAGQELFAVNAPITASAGLQVLGLGPGLDAVVTGRAIDYEVTSWATAVSAAALDAAGTDYPEAVRAQYLQLPAGLPERVRGLARRLAGEAPTPYTQVVRLQDYLRANYPYSLEVPPPPAGADAVDYFLFDAPGGFCTYYASALAVLLRVEGVPARVVTGFAMGSYAVERAAWRVPAAAAHAWVEVYFPGYGWVEFEPTPAQARPDYGPLAEPQPAPPPRAEAGAPAPRVVDWGLIAAAGAAGLAAGL